MCSFFFGNQLSKLYTLTMTICIGMALGIPFSDADTFRQSGISVMLMWVGYWLLSIPFCIYGLFQVRKKQRQTKLQHVFQ